MIQTTLFSTIIKTDLFSSLELSPNDWLIPSTSTISCIYFYDIQQWSLYQTQPNDLFINTEQLILSLRKLLEYYPLLDGVLRTFDEDKRACVEHDDVKGGILFVSTMVNISLHEIPLASKEYTNTKILPETLRLINVDDCERLFHVCHTRFACGSVALGISLNHQLADAHSYFQLIKDWTRLYKNLEYQPNVCHQRSLLELTSEEIQTLKTTNPDFNNRRSLAVKEESISLPLSTKEVIVKVFRFSASELGRMKADFSIHLPSDVDYVSTFEVLTAHLYQHVMLARRHHHPQSTTTGLYIATNIRPRLIQPSLPSTYFGNALMFSYLEMSIANIMHRNLASQIHQAIQANTNDDIRTTLAWIQCQGDKTTITPTFHLDTTDFTISAWNKMGMYSDSDFEDEIHPCRILLSPEMKFNGATILFSTEMNDGSIDVILCLEVNEMERIETNANFRKYRREEE